MRGAVAIIGAPMLLLGVASTAEATSPPVAFSDRPRACSGRVLFTRLRLVFTRRPGGGQPVGSLTLCSR